MVIDQSIHIIEEITKAFTGKEEIIKKCLMAIYAKGHILMEDVPGVGKTTLALAFSKAIGLDYKRIQFTIDTLPSDIIGFTMFNQQTNVWEYREGAANCNFLLADEINRTSPKTQAALLEVMEEKTITVDGITHKIPEPFCCIATQNPFGTAGTNALPESQLDRFMICLSIGYPDKKSQMDIIRARKEINPLETIQKVATKESILELQQYLTTIYLSDEILSYIVDLCEATRNHPMVALGVSPRGVLALCQMSRAHAIISERNYVTPEDVQDVFIDVCAHRLVLHTQAKIESVSKVDVLYDILSQIKPEYKMR
ncbi:MoxR-like ATPase [Lachnospiraceae bacterium TWA4]|nr:MoxR-like ATPase [Lachnospiraceae bacterium TWA4]